MAFEVWPLRAPSIRPRRMRDDELSSTEVVRRAGVTYRQLDYWCRIGILNPIGNHRGSGQFRRWCIDDVEVVATLGRLSAMGAEAAVLERVAAAVSRWLASSELQLSWLVVPLNGPVSWVTSSDLACDDVGALAVDTAAWVLCMPSVLGLEGELAQESAGGVK